MSSVAVLYHTELNRLKNELKSVQNECNLLRVQRDRYRLLVTGHGDSLPEVDAKVGDMNVLVDIVNEK